MEQSREHVGTAHQREKKQQKKQKKPSNTRDGQRGKKEREGEGRVLMCHNRLFFSNRRRFSVNATGRMFCESEAVSAVSCGVV